MKKYYRIELNVTSTEWATCECYVDAESEEEAREKFEVDPDKYEWDEWEIHDSEVRDWGIERIAYDEWMTKNTEVTDEESDTHKSTCDKKEQ